MGSVTLYTQEARQLLAAGSVVRVRAMDMPRDENGETAAFGVGTYAPTKVDKDGEEYPDDDVFGIYSLDGDWGMPLRQPGSVVACREPWACEMKSTDTCTDEEVEINPGHFTIWRQSQCFDGGKELFNTNFLGKWRSASTMPAWAVRPEFRECRVASVDLKRVQEVTADECKAAGFDVTYFEMCSEQERYFRGKSDCTSTCDMIVRNFRRDFDARNKPGRRWDDNPYVTVERIERFATPRAGEEGK